MNLSDEEIRSLTASQLQQYSISDLLKIVSRLQGQGSDWPDPSSFSSFGSGSAGGSGKPPGGPPYDLNTPKALDMSWVSGQKKDKNFLIKLIERLLGLNSE